MLPIDQIICGDCRDVLQAFPPESIDMVMFSPPYYGLREYGEHCETVWGGDPDCEHDFSVEAPPRRRRSVNDVKNPFSKQATVRGSAFNATGGVYCTKCGAWRGELGLEPTWRLYVDHLVEVCRELKRVLKKTGSMYIVLGDTYAGSRCGSHDYRQEYSINKPDRYNKPVPQANVDLPPKCLIGVPWRVALALIDDGWILRNCLCWHKCLAGSTLLFTKIDGSYRMLTVRELYDNFSHFREVLVPSMKMNGEKVWIRVKNVYYNGKAETRRIVLTNGNTLIATPNHLLPVLKTSKRRSGKYFKLSLMPVSEIRPGYHLWTITKFSTDLPEGSEADYNRGYFLGFWLAEGNFIKRGRNNKGTKFSLYALKRWAKEKGYDSVEEYLKARGDEEIVGLEFACGVKDREKGYLDKLSEVAKISIYQYGNSIVVKSYGSENLVYPYVYGNSAKDKSITDAVFNESLSFLRGVLDGFLDGDSQHRGTSSRVTITKNEKLANALMMIAKLVGREFRICKSGSNSLSFNVSNYDKRIVDKGIVFQAVRKIEDNGIEDVYDIEVEPIYTTYCGKGKTEKPSMEKRKAKWNNLYFLANGIFTHNSNAMPSSVRDRYSNKYEFIFFFVKSRRYYFDLDSIREPHKIESVERWERALRQASDTEAKLRRKRLETTGVTVASMIPKWFEYTKHDLAVGRIGNFSYADPLHARAYHPMGKNPGDVIETFYKGLERVYEKMREVDATYDSKYKETPYGQTLQSFQREDRLAKMRRASREVARELFPDDEKLQQDFVNWVHDHAGDVRGRNPGDVVKWSSPDSPIVEYFRGRGSGGHYDYGGLSSPEGKHYAVGGKNPGDVLRAPLNSKFLEADLKTASPAARTVKALKEGKLTTHVKRKILEVGEYLKQKKRESGLTIAELSRMTGIRKTTLEHYFRTDFSGQAIPDRRTWDLLKPILNLGDYDEFVSEEVRCALPQPHPLGRNPGDFWSIALRPFKGKHFSVYPPEICVRPILSSSPPGGIVLDPMCGSGTTCMVAKALGRRYIGIDINWEYVEMARRRVGAVTPPLSPIRNIDEAMEAIKKINWYTIP
jgi:DNA modification methylase